MSRLASYTSIMARGETEVTCLLHLNSGQAGHGAALPVTHQKWPGRRPNHLASYTSVVARQETEPTLPVTHQ